MVEGSNQAGLLREHHAVAEHVTRHITNTDGGEFLRLAVMAQHLGAEVVAAIRPAQAAAGHVAEAQVHALHARGVHENLVLGVRQGRENEFLGGDLKRQGFTVKVRVGAQHGADHAGQ